MIRTIQYGVPIARVELLDPTTITAVNKYSGLSIEEKPTLFFEFHGTESSVKAQSDVSFIHFVSHLHSKACSRD